MMERSSNGAAEHGRLDIESMRRAAEQACALLKTLGNPDRLMLLCHLTQGEYCVSELEEISGLRQPSLSQQLGVLRDEALVTTRRAGKQIFYSMASKESIAVMGVLYELYCKPSAEQGA